MKQIWHHLPAEFPPFYAGWKASTWIFFGRNGFVFDSFTLASRIWKLFHTCESDLGWADMLQVRVHDSKLQMKVDTRVVDAKLCVCEARKQIFWIINFLRWPTGKWVVQCWISSQIVVTQSLPFFEFALKVLSFLSLQNAWSIPYDSAARWPPGLRRRWAEVMSSSQMVQRLRVRTQPLWRGAHLPWKNIGGKDTTVDFFPPGFVSNVWSARFDALWLHLPEQVSGHLSWVPQFYLDNMGTSVAKERPAEIWSRWWLSWISNSQKKYISLQEVFWQKSGRWV